MVIFLISLIVYIICIYIGVKYTMRDWDDKDAILTAKEKLLAVTWFVFFISSQMLMIDRILNWTGLIK